MYPLWIALMRFLFNPPPLRLQKGGGVSATILLRPITRNSNKIEVQGLTAVSDYSSNEIGVADGSNVLPFSVALDTKASSHLLSWIYDWSPIDLSTATARSIADRPNNNSTIRSSTNNISPK